MENEFLTEAIVEEVAVDYLNEYYQRQYRGPVFSARQFWLKERKGRADGFVAVRDEDGNIHIASVEAKSSKTWGEILPSPNQRLIRRGALVVSTLFSVIVGFYTLWLSSWSVALIAAVVTLAVSFGILIVVFSELPFFQRTSMIDDRLVKYKANERWLALPEDAYSQLYPEEQHKLLGRCHSDGIGLLLVGSQRHVSIVLKAVYRASSEKEGHYLDLYSRANEVKAKLTPDHR